MVYSFILIVSQEGRKAWQKEQRETTNMNKLLLEANREGYGLDQIRSTMTVGELIAFLSDYDEDTEIYISNDRGYTYGSITESDFREAAEEGEEDDE